MNLDMQVGSRALVTLLTCELFSYRLPGTLAHAAWPKAFAVTCLGSIKCLDGPRLLVNTDALTRQNIAAV